ncbi:MAG: DNA mismatch repair endonuclease MutL [Cryomorphaceae bacterium]|nr:MAG: DNA mismatch repair endonuclease MutL [Cryomorphaceae bacterium]
MSDIIKLLPDSVANQIAAGEVIQRPASAVKELIENAVDANSTRIQLAVKDAGRTLIRVIDNGSGMSETDARMSFERHATSKINDAQQLFSITTKGFRGEALASIAAVAQVDMQTRSHHQDVGTRILIEGSRVKSQNPEACPVGTSIAVRNLFFNVPARRNFLKSDPVELRHIIEEFHRVALAHPDIAFSLTHNDNALFDLPAGKRKQRIVGIFGEKFNERIVPVEEETPVLKIEGFVGKPEFSRKTRGEQYFFVNNRFIKSGYLNHAVNIAYQELLQSSDYPAYFLYLQIDPAEIDINIHPTKTEIKFKDEKLVYAMLNSAVKRALGRFNLTPTLDFERETSFDFPEQPNSREVRPPTIDINPDYNPFRQPGGNQGVKSGHSEAFRKLRDMYEGVQNDVQTIQQDSTVPGTAALFNSDEEKNEYPCFQMHQKYIVTSIRSGILWIHQQRAHERVLYEQLVANMAHNKQATQQALFPDTLRFTAAESELLRSMLPEVRQLGFDLEEMGNQGFVVNGLPVDAAHRDPRSLIEELLEQYQLHGAKETLRTSDRLARSLAATLAIKTGQRLQQEEMRDLLDRLFGCEVPGRSPSGKPTIVSFTLDEIDAKFD